ncbi:DUF1801 domain-containing protein [Flavobacterium sp. Fl-318]|uniref:DUF1801 domain-containing protein n=1 Tax=Flavobacterium cupriresistens TaxID=2893885 RepID=A0ABU4RG12_9FLAO|nr:MULTISPECIES: DUF1801 domain-containing protein [unclassified Flavobacterium]MDX6189451.1 DUF1801 domain-containing protein [Flavobacterium sp. Fl-318]UFH41139.1 DUF1801 domain-containing protein [Flavobacterium sp. F-323]
MKEVDNFYERQEEPLREVLLALKEIILKQDEDISNVLKYGMPFFCYKGKMFCYLWIHKKNKQPYIGIVEGKHFDESFLIQESRSRMKIMMLSSNEDLPIDRIEKIVQKAIKLYMTGIIKIKNK